jgi:ubiquinone/menaquinone biosynthesis C-methylase UbiE
MEFVLAGEKLQRCRTAYLDRAANAESILIVGEGNGRFLAECRRRIPSARIKVLDASAKMLEAARLRLLRSGLNTDCIEFVHADAASWKPDHAAYDLIVTHYFLDCFPAQQLRQIIATLSQAAKPAAAWLLADFQIPSRGWRRGRARIIHALMYFFFRVMVRLPANRLVAPDEFLTAQNFVLESRRTSEWGLLHTDYWRRLRARERAQSA